MTRLGRCSRWNLALAWGVTLGLWLVPAPLHAQLLSSISITFAAAANSVPMTGAGTDTAGLNFGTVSAFEPLGTGVSRTVGASSYTLSTNFGVKVTKNLLGLLSPNYTLRARLQSAQTLTWRVNGTLMTTTDAVVGTSQPYGSPVTHSLSFVVPFSRAAGNITTVLEITAIAN